MKLDQISSDHNKTDDKSHNGSVGPTVIIRGLTYFKGLEGVELLDTLITYLWRIHGVDYYGMIETNEAKGFRHVRPERTGHEETVMAAKENIDAAAIEVLDPSVRKIRDEKYGWKYVCGAKGCTKLFHAAEVVYKHLKLKHLELALEQTSKLREDLYTQNYINDPDAPGGKPVMQQPQSEFERDFYDALFMRAKTWSQQFMRTGLVQGAIVMQTAAHIFVALYEGSIGPASRAMAAADQLTGKLGRKNL
ncbi:serrate RNA effector molecule-like protein, putative [Medicago truncatula]|uniref:Serrate RNA effector molecule-like protein, putative n=1 Tax=Medicago truncatula TaxID=3880 RepID=A0A072VBW7_MEDTR|nr:serrate RNA effector molecule-like protein, putative [Medicago truncatula]